MNGRKTVHPSSTLRTVWRGAHKGSTPAFETRAKPVQLLPL
ncbi:hypothetical protein THTE_3849 [Thermogutta terrifontis]|uniref:Uncharacterized protein n=1 Tax=Thermogutta terrifontis TaxID=1331910 RepID=A0A286RKH0_9BACT|nr:hypothetical protein THTE_3849 [Thermogutta terrifontis]